MKSRSNKTLSFFSSVAPHSLMHGAGDIEISPSSGRLSGRLLRSFLSLFSKNHKIGSSNAIPTEVEEFVQAQKSTEDAGDLFRGFRDIIKGGDLQKISDYITRAQQYKSSDNADLVDRNGDSFLHIAVETQNKKAMEEVFKYTKNPTLENKAGKDPLGTALEKMGSSDCSLEIYKSLQSLIKSRKLSIKRGESMRSITSPPSSTRPLSSVTLNCPAQQEQKEATRIICI